MLTYTNCTFCFYLCMALNIQMCTCCVLGCNTISFIVVHTPCPSIYNCTYACHIKAEHMGANGAVEMGSEMGYCCFAILLGQLLSFLDHSKYFTGQNFSTARYHKSFSLLQCFHVSKGFFCRKKNGWLHSPNPVSYLIFVIFLHRQNFWRIKFTPKFTQ